MDAEDIELFQTFKTFFGYSYANAAVQSQMISDKTQLLPMSIVILLLLKLMSIVQSQLTIANITLPYITDYINNMLSMSRQLLVQLLVIILAPWTQSLLHDTLFGTIISIWVLYTLVYIADNAVNPRQ